MIDPPDEVRTQRLLLRRVTLDDFDAAVSIHAEPEATRYRSSGPATPDETRKLLEGWLAHWTEHGFGYWAIVLPETGEIIGFGGVRFSYLGGEQYLNVYYRLSPTAWGHGYAPEMVKAAVTWAERALPAVPILVITNVDNTPAMKVAEKAGFAEFRQGEFAGVPSRFYRYVGR